MSRDGSVTVSLRSCENHKALGTISSHQEFSEDHPMGLHSHHRVACTHVNNLHQNYKPMLCFIYSDFVCVCAT